MIPRQHRTNIITETTAKPLQLRPGDIITFSYTGPYMTNPRPTTLVLNPRWRGYMHGVSLTELTPGQLEKMKKMVDITLAGRIQKLIKLRLPLLKPDIGNPERFYHSRLKPFIQSMQKSPYRTYEFSHIKGLKVLEYRFKK